MISRIHTNNDTANFEVVNGLRPSLIANLRCFPAPGKRRLKQRPNISNREQNIALETETRTRDNAGPEVMPHGLKGIFLEHGPEVAGLLVCFLLVDSGDELETLPERHVGPVGSVGVVHVVGVEQGVENALLVLAHVLPDVHVLGSNMFAGHVGSMGGSDAIVPKGIRAAILCSHIRRLCE